MWELGVAARRGSPATASSSRSVESCGAPDDDVSAALALLSSLLWGTSDYLGGTASRRLPAAVVVLGSQACALLLLVPAVLVLGGGPLGNVLAGGMAAGALGALSLLAFYRALAIGTMGVVAPVAALGVAVPVAAGLVAGESPTAPQLAGIAVAVAGVVLASGPELRGQDRRSGGRSLALALLSALGFGTVFVLLARGAGPDRSVGRVLLLLLVMRATSVLLLAVIRAVHRSRPAVAAPELRRALPLLVVVGAFDVGANGTFAVASQAALVSVTAVLSSLFPVVTALLAWRLDAERLARGQWCGVGLAVGGVALLAAG